ncbi:MAG: ABC transporter permease [Ignavibacteriales bacterium]|nr:ABC transporter permease [Ignavibacteriales bacterium]
MFRSYLKIALRNLLKRKVYSAINITGLSLGLTCCLLIFEYVTFEYGFDRFNENFPDLYRVTETGSRSGGTEALEGYALGPALDEAVPEVVRFARLHPDYNIPVISSAEHPEKVFEEKSVYYTDPAFLQMFTYPLVSGDLRTALVESGTMLLSESAARKYFGTDNPIGKTLNVTGWIKGVFRVNGVLRDVPTNSHLQFDFLLPMTDLLQKSGYKDPTLAWHWSNFLTYVQLQPGVNIGEVGRKFTNVVMTHRKEHFERTKTSVRVNAQPLRDVYLNGSIFAPKAISGSYRTVYFFIVVGVVTLLIALVNYVNLSTARSLDRAREVGIRKTIGAQRKQLVLQFLVESALTNIGAILLALVSTEFLRPMLNQLAGTQLTIDLLSRPEFWGAVAAISLAGTLLAGLYPAFVLSSFLPASVLKGKGGTSSFLRIRLRQGLVVFQFAAAVVLLAGTAIVHDQLNYVRHMDIGMNLNRVLAVRGPTVLPEGAQKTIMMGTLMEQLRQIPAIEQITRSSALPGEGFNWYSSGLRQSTADPSTGVRGAMAWIDSGFAELFDLELIAGVGFESNAVRGVEGQPTPVIANETAIRNLRFDFPEQSLNQLIHIGGEQCRIVGVYKDFNWSSAHSPREAVLFTPTQAGSKLALKVNSINLGQTIADIRRVYTTIFPGNPFDYYFVDERFDEQYRNDERFATLFGVFAILTILIGCLGLFGLVSFSTEQRLKEVGVRKVLGASITSLVGLLTKEFVFLVCAGNVLAWPVTYHVMSLWLEDFAFRIEIAWWVFALAGGLTLFIALLTVSVQAVKAALANPVEALRYE